MEPRMIRSSLPVRLLLVILPAAGVMLGGMILVTVHLSQQVVERFINDYGRDTAQREALAISAGIQKEMTLAEGAARLVSALAATREREGAAPTLADRRHITEYLRQAAALHPEAVGVWFYAEPDALGPDAAALATEDPQLGMAGTGRYALYATSQEGTVRLQSPPADFDTQDYYTRAQRSHRLAILPVHIFPIQGVPTALVSHAFPAMVGDRLIGVAGVDLDQRERAHVYEGHHPFGAPIAIIDTAEVWDYHPDPARLGSTATFGDGPDYQFSPGERVFVDQAQPYSLERRLADGSRLRRFTWPVDLFPGEGKRLLVMDVPLDRLARPFAGIRSAILMAGLLCALLLTGLMILAVRLIVAKPLKRLQAGVDCLKRGDYERTLPDQSCPDVIGDLARGLEDFRQTLVERDHLRRDLQRVAACIAVAHDAIYMMSRDYRVLYANDQALALIGIANAESLLGKRIGQFVTPETAAKLAGLRQQITTSLAHRGMWTGRLDNWTTLTGHRIEAVEFTASNDPGGDILVVARDVSERDRVERERQVLQRHILQQDKLETVGRLAGGVAHDFNNLLGAILGYAGFLVADLPVGSPARGYADRILAVGASAKELVRQILGFARTDAGVQEVLPARAIVEDAQVVLRSTVPATTRLTCTTEEGLPPLRANQTQMMQVLMNLVINAHDARRNEAGDITIRLNRGPLPFTFPPDWTVVTTLPAPVDAPHVVLEVADQGTGLAPDHLARMFEPFFTTKGQDKGTGLGLANVHSIVKAHGGGLAVASKLGTGTVIRITLPSLSGPSISGPTAVAIPSDLTAVPPPPHRSPARLRVLVVDDTEAMGELLREGLTRRGHDVTVCGEPQAALRLLADKAWGYNALITDQTMPGMTGLSLIHAAKGGNPGLICVLCTGYSANVDEATARAGGADAFFIKPLSVKTLMDRLDALYGTRD
ncbi:ATP-binding protein [Nitrospirillum sp. BR 11163]|uniref:ATP-binding protein n=1 Tax=Nitrospirillum sp. BR 11163 TaxID=3104323 RepID=UPI002AFEFC30|nr:ATP-binding protein [Nitrospirillum sp. BR 11163]MEA1672452.1 ATP-binding protein [Nitrospirillum sp. BR 11163]